MKKISTIIFGTLLIYILGFTGVSPAFASWQDARFRQAERAALRNGTYGSPSQFKDNYVKSLYVKGQLQSGYANNYTLTTGVSLTLQVQTDIKNALKNNQSVTSWINDPNFGYYPLGNLKFYTIAALQEYLLGKLQTGQGLLVGDIIALYGSPNPGQKGGVCASTVLGATECISGYYAVQQPDGSYLYYPLGQGPNPTKQQGDVVTPVPPPGVVRARGVITATIAQTCDEIKAAANYRNGSQFDLRLGTASQGVQTQNGSNYVSWTLNANTFRLLPLSTGTSSIRVCLTDSTGSHFGEYSVALAGGATDTFDVAYGPPPPWFQGQGGDVYADGSIISLTSANAVPRQVVLSGAGNYPGIVTYGGAPTDYDFAMEDANNGSTYVSSKNWLVNDKAGRRDFYNYFYSKFGNPTAADYTSDGSLTLPTYDATKSFYYAKANMTTSGDWSVTDGQKYIFLIDGNLTINGKINITGNGFIAFIVSGNITVSPSVGVAFNSSSPVVEGVYITSKTIHTGASTVAGAERFVGKGIFVGNDVGLERDLSAVNPTGAYSSELFIYNPGLLVLMPDIMKTVPVSWQEVAP